MHSAAAAEAPLALKVAAWGAIPGLVHGFFGRRGGVSSGDCASLNVSDRVDDHPASVAANWQRVGEALSHLPVVRMRQVHGHRVVSVSQYGQPPDEADAMLTRAAGLALAVLTADCVPILAVAPAHGAVMAVHAGWRGTLAGVAAEAVRTAREALGISPAAWQVALGPAIGPCCYEVESSIGDAFVDRWGAMPDAWQPVGARGQLDLRAANRRILADAGIAVDHMVDIGPCTSCAHAEFFSHRQSRGRAGRQLSAIGWATAVQP